jgi:hypothetical protein
MLVSDDDWIRRYNESKRIMRERKIERRRRWEQRLEDEGTVAKKKRKQEWELPLPKSAEMSAAVFLLFELAPDIADVLVPALRDDPNESRPR